jgi:hypothetical protein
MARLGQGERCESIHDFVRRAMAEAKLVISEIEKAHIEIEETALSAANAMLASGSRQAEAKVS